MNGFSSLALIALSLGVGYLVGLPMYAEIQDLSSKKQEYQTALESFNSIESLKQTLNQKLNNLTLAEQDQIKVLLPSAPDTVKLIADVDAIGSKYGISIDDVSYKNPNVDNSQSVATAAPANGYQTLQVSFSFTSDYSKLKNFLSDLESSLRLIDVREIDLKTSESGVNTYIVNTEIYYLPAK